MSGCLRLVKYYIMRLGFPLTLKWHWLQHFHLYLDRKTFKIFSLEPTASVAFWWPLTYPTPPSVFHADQHGMRALESEWGALDWRFNKTQWNCSRGDELLTCCDSLNWKNCLIVVEYSFRGHLKLRKVWREARLPLISWCVDVGPPWVQTGMVTS